MVEQRNMFECEKNVIEKANAVWKVFTKAEKIHS